ncbi:MAG TPA: alcohol dehydrogenase catalytic domain-containing protein [Gemmatimonadaceae bacterium]|nr:alcohol dehydrogenase catalytic domain-containing protein [Gemmatimonadaceae bacterium]
MKAISFAAPIPTYLATLLAGKLSGSLLVGPHACTRFGDVADPVLPGDDWVRVRTRMGGICGSDLAIVTLGSSPSTSPFSSFPFVLGHEIVGEVTEVGAGARGVRAGDRVAVNPLLCCETRGMAPVCPACRDGHHSRCAHFTDGALPPGMLLGTTRGLGGGWGEQLVAHQSQLVKVPDEMTDAEAVLVEPLACSVHAVRRSRLDAGDRVLVIGAGSIGLLTVAAVHALAPEARISVLARHAFQGDHATRLGAERVISARGDYTRALADAAGTRLLKPIIGKPVGVGGFDRTFVCITGSRGVEDAMRVTRAGGTIVLLGNATTFPGVDWTPLWLKELTVRGSLCYGEHRHASPATHAFREAAALIASGQAPVGPLLTHRFPIGEYRQALSAAMDKGDARSVKVAFVFPG